MSKSLSKSRPGGGQSQSNQGQPDYRQAHQNRQTYNIRQGNTQVHSVTSNSIPQVNMHPQAQAPQPIPAQVIPNQANPIMQRHQAYAGQHQQPNSQSLVPQQQIGVGHVNQSAQQNAPVLQTPIIRNPQQFQYIQHPTRMQTIPNQRQPSYPRPNNTVATHQIHPSMQNQHQQIYYNQYANMYHPNVIFPMPAAYVSQPQMMYSEIYNNNNIRSYSAQQQINMQTNMQQNEIINQNMYQQQPQHQQPKTEKKREKKLLKIFNEDGTEVNLNEAANNTDDIKTSAPKDSSSNEKILVETKNSVLEESASPSVNGIEKELELLNDVQKFNDLPKEELKEELIEYPDVNDLNDSIQATSSVDEVANDQCDNETNNDTKVPPLDILDIKQEIDDVTQKMDDIALENQAESTNLGEVITDDEHSPSVHDNSKLVPANTISGDMEVDTAKSVDDSVIDQSNVEDSKTDDVSLNPISKDEVNNESNIDSKLSRNSSLNGPYVYEKDFLLSLRENATDYAISNSNQENMRDIIKGKGNKNVPSFSNENSFLPNFATNQRGSQNDSYRNNKSQAQPSRRTSQPNKNYQDAKSRKIASTSLQHDMYTPNENAWRPNKNTTDDPIEIETENLLKHVRAILNKLTPQNYQTLLEQFKGFKIDTKNRLTRVIDLIFDKAVKEPSFVVQYAGFCSELIHIKVTETNAKGENVEVKFKNLLIKKCEETFFREMYSDIENFNEKVKEIEECTDEKRKKELEEIIDDDKRLSRRRSIGNIKLIAELYKLNMLNAKIMFSCFHNLLKHQHEEYIECLCALITNIGLNLTNAIKSKSADQMDSFESIFTQLSAIYDNKSPLKVSSRIRFMLLDLLDLRKNNWVPRRKADGPKTIAQVHEDMDKEARLKVLELSEYKKKKPLGPRDRDQDDWQQVKNRKGSNVGPTKVSLSQLKDSLNAGKAVIGANFGGMFVHGSHGGTSSNSQSRSSSSNFENKYSLLSNEKAPKSNSTFHDSLHAKDPRRDERKTSDVTNYYQSNRDGSLPNSRNSSTRSDIFEAKSEIEIDRSTFQSKTYELVESYFKSQNFNQTVSELLTFCSKTCFNTFLSDSLGAALEKNAPKRQSWGQFLGQLFVIPIYDCSEIFEGFKVLFSTSSDILIDLPKFWEFVAEIIAYALIKVEESDKENLKKEVFKAISRAFGEVTGKELSKLRNSISETLTKLDKDVANEIIFYLQFNSQANAKNDIHCPESNLIEAVKVIVDKSMNFNCDITSIEKELHVDTIERKQFIRALFNHILNKYTELKDNNKDKDINRLWDIVRHYVKSDPDTEMDLLYMSAELFVGLNCPSNFLSECFTIFHTEKLVSEDSFKQFQTSKRSPPLSLAAVEGTIKRLFHSQ